MQYRRAKTVLQFVGWLLALGASASAAADCYTVYDAQNRVVYQSVEPPFDLSVPYSQGVAATFSPAHAMVVTPSNAACPEVDQRPRRKAAFSPAGSKGAPAPSDMDTAAEQLSARSAALAALEARHASPYVALGGEPPLGDYTGGGTVRVRSYMRRDGTVVSSHTRRAPRR